MSSSVLYGLKTLESGEKMEGEVQYFLNVEKIFWDSQAILVDTFRVLRVSVKEEYLCQEQSLKTQQLIKKKHKLVKVVKI